METKNPKYSIILPTYQERKNIHIMMWLIFDTAQKNNINLEVVVVEDNSPDGTADVVVEL